MYGDVSRCIENNARIYQLVQKFIKILNDLVKILFPLITSLEEASSHLLSRCC